MRRFIAGAVCPRCALMDKIVMFEEGGQKHRQCVSCGFRDIIEEAPLAGEVETRVNQPRAGATLAHEDDVQILDLGTPATPKKPKPRDQG